MEAVGNIRRRRLALYNETQRRGHRIWGYRNNFSKHRLLRRVAIFSAVLLSLFSIFILYPSLEYNHLFENTYKQGSLDYSESVAVNVDDLISTSKRYSTDALKSKPETKYKVTEQVIYGHHHFTNCNL